MSRTESGTPRCGGSPTRATGSWTTCRFCGISTRADLVALLTADVDVCGIGWLMGPGNVSANFESSGYSVTVWDCANTILALPA